MTKLISYLITLLFSVSFGYAQQFNNAIKSLKIYKLDSLEIYKLNELNEIEKYYLNWQKKMIIDGRVDTLKIDNITFNEKNKRNTILKHLIYGDYYSYKRVPDDTLAFTFYLRALNDSKTNNDTILIAESCKKILRYVYKRRRALELYKDYLPIYKQYLYDNNEKATYTLHYLNYKSIKQKVETIDELKIGLEISESTKNIYLTGKYHQIIGLHYNYYNKDINNALKHFLKAQYQLNSKPYNFFKNELFGIYGNLGNISREKNNLKEAKIYYLKANAIEIPRHKDIQKVKLYQVLSDIDYQQQKFKSAYEYLVKKNNLYQEVNEFNKAVALNEINTKYQTVEKEKENLQLKADNLEIETKRKQNRNLLIGALALLLFGGITFYLIQKNTKRKQLIAEQEKELQTQKVTTLLKEQELTAIDAMIEGQEKERQRIANDLHDDLGGLMATVKLHFNALKEKQSPELFDKTNNLLDEAYNKIRTVAHAKNSGVMAKQGLLKAVKEMAHTVSVSNKMSIDVIDHGLDERLENSLELTIFRIIQELITNVIKHAQATEASIHITNHEDSLNIMVEDNGKGFNTKNILRTSGMGIHSIDKRIENLGGTVTIESELNKGTTVIIDIPS